ncbi:helix-turn-helix domain-containing protein [Pseudomonas syringae group genomosp. 3]|uniref:helix-turn-helix domain-containing protein n=1 Tax=Pseudomonas syringae group genomosp. 3 TaxID=251701 RepID=UPI0006B9B823|nr:helix-turn-helix domain-containing protein [Pseudomonas syringae group genomosp. 3]KPC13021.1 Replication protein [Pseudomonas syringae pv. maculicola]
MSMELMVKAMKTKVGNPLRKLVLVKLADNASDQGECWPSYQHIADQCEIDRSTVRRHIKNLADQGLLRIENRAGPKGNSSNLYFLTLQGGGTDSTPVGPKSTGVGTQPTPPVGPESTRTSHSSEPVIEPKPLCKPDSMEGFDQFWKLYPKKKSLKDAKKAWAKLAPNPDLRQTLITALGKQRLQRDWIKDGGQYVPLASTWLNGEKWADDIGPLASGTTVSRHTQLDQVDHTDGLELDGNGNYRIAGDGQ